MENWWGQRWGNKKSKEVYDRKEEEEGIKEKITEAGEWGGTNGRRDRKRKDKEDAADFQALFQWTGSYTCHKPLVCYYVTMGTHPSPNKHLWGSGILSDNNIAHKDTTFSPESQLTLNEVQQPPSPPGSDAFREETLGYGGFSSTCDSVTLKTHIPLFIPPIS